MVMSFTEIYKGITLGRIKMADKIDGRNIQKHYPRRDKNKSTVTHWVYDQHFI